jgi:hypothetical protein
MSVNMEDIRNGIVANLSTITGCQKNAYRSGNNTPPAIVVAGFDVMEPTSFSRGGHSFTMLVQGLAGKPLNKAAEVRLDKWLLPGGDEDVWAAIESDRTLNHTVDNCAVTSCDGSQLITLDNGTEVLGTTWHLQIEL